MSVEEIAGLNRQFYTGDGSTDEFEHEIQLLETSVVKAYVAGVEDTNITVVNDDDLEGGSVTFDTPPANGAEVMIHVTEPIDQPTEFEPLSAFPETDMEFALDRLTHMARQFKEALKRAIKLKINSTEVDLTMSEPSAGKPIKWKADETGFENGDRDLDDIVDEAEAAEAAAEAAQSGAEAAQSAAEIAQAAAEAAQAAAELAAGSLTLGVSGSRGTPNNLVAGTAHIPSVHYRQTAFIQGSGGPVTVSANPQIAAGSTVGQILTLVGRSDVNTVTYSNGNGLALNGDCTLEADNVLTVEWDGTNWRENSRSH